MIEDKKGHIDVTIRAKGAEVNDNLTVAKIKIGQGVFTYTGGGGFSAKDLISTDRGNYLKLGSDDKLLSKIDDENFVAYYILNRD